MALEKLGNGTGIFSAALITATFATCLIVGGAFGHSFSMIGLGSTLGLCSLALVTVGIWNKINAMKEAYEKNG